MKKLPRAREAARKYLTDPVLTTMSSKRQITIPAAVARELELKPGMKLEVQVENGEIVLHPRRMSVIEEIIALPAGYYGTTKEDVDAYMRESRQGWEDRARLIEGDSYIEPDD